MLRSRDPITGVRKAVLITALVVGTFGIGVSEFLVMGLLPQIASDLAGPLYRHAPNAAMAAAGGLVTSYALGVVVGTAVTPALLRHVSERSALATCASSMLIFTLLTALAPTLTVAIVFRFLAALTHATYTGMATVLVARLLGKNFHGRGSAIVMSGLTLANLLGVPALTFLGSAHGDWRMALSVCCILFAVPLLALALIRTPSTTSLPARSDDSASSTAHGTVMLMVVITLVTGGGFAMMTYAAPVALWAQGQSALVPVAVFMLVFGVGMNLGNLIGGWAADRSAELTVWVCSALGIAAAGILMIPAHSWVAPMLAMLVVGLVLSGVNPGAMVLYIRELPRRPRFAASLASGTANLGSVLGSMIGAVMLTGRGPAAVPLGAVTLTALGMLFLFLRAVVRSRAVRE